MPGWILLSILIYLLGWTAARSVYPFLALEAPVGAQLLVVDGWMSPPELVRAAAIFRSGGYQRLVAVGGPTHRWPRISAAETHAHLAAEFLRRRGVPESAIVAVPSPITPNDRTYTSALMLRAWAERTATPLGAVDLATRGPHARRSRLLYEIALGPGTKVGTHPVAPADYDPERWWATSTGAKEVTEQALGWIWVKCLFRPPPADSVIDEDQSLSELGAHTPRHEHSPSVLEGPHRTRDRQASSP